MSIELTTLPSGVRVLTDTVDTVESIAIGVWASVGTRHENLAEGGIAHLVEHMMFKGTPTRSARDIDEAVEDVGGQMNAYTTREMTAYHIHLLKDHLGLSLDVLADILQHPLFDEEELARERQVILQEIGMYADTPDEHIFDLYQQAAFPGQTLGAPVLGRAEVVAAMPRPALTSYVRSHYTPSRLIVSAAGNVSHREVVDRVSALFTDLPSDVPCELPPGTYHGGETRLERDLEQSHVILGFRGIPRPDPDHTAAQALSVILGGGSSSRLNHEVRQKRGLVYSIYSYNASWHDEGLFQIYAGTGPDRLPELVPVVCAEIAGILKEPVTDRELDRAKAQMRSHILMGRESMMSRADQQARHLVYHGAPPDLGAILRRIDQLTPQDLHRVARRIFTTKPTLAALGPLEKLESYDRIRDRLAA